MRNLLSLALLLCACDDDIPARVMFQNSCTAEAPSAEALLPASRLSDGSVILIDGRKITPAGKVLVVGGFLTNLRVLPQDGGRYVVATDASYGDNYLRV